MQKLTDSLNIVVTEERKCKNNVEYENVSLTYTSNSLLLCTVWSKKIRTPILIWKPPTHIAGNYVSLLVLILGG
jgi:hypothetical protein